jgi:hypothetical protein
MNGIIRIDIWEPLSYELLNYHHALHQQKKKTQLHDGIFCWFLMEFQTQKNDRIMMVPKTELQKRYYTEQQIFTKTTGTPTPS